jgi:type 1 fimbriae regulatory protein FimB
MSVNHPRRERRSREFLAPDEVQKLLDACRREGVSRNRERDYCLLLLMFRHGLRVSEACQLKVTDINLKEKVIHIQRLKNGNSTTQPMYHGEVGAVNAWLKARDQMQPLDSNFLFLSERRQPLSRFTVRVLIKKYADAARLGNLEIHPHMLRHACGYSLANRGADTRLIQDYLGHKNITHTVRYTKLAPGRFNGLF